MAPKKKVTKVSLNEFLADESTGSWAEETAFIPTMPVKAYEDGDSSFHGRGSGGGGGDARGPSSFGGGYGGGRSAMGPPRRDQHAGGPPPPRRQREQIPIPDSPPFVAFVGGLPHSITDEDMKELVAGLQVSSIRLVRDHSGVCKGFGYVDFEDRESLVNVMSLNGESFHGRFLSVNVAESKRNAGHGDRSEMAGNWRRDQPLQPQHREEHGFRGGDRMERREPRPRHEREEENVDLGAFRRATAPRAPSHIGRPDIGGPRSRSRDGRSGDRPQSFASSVDSSRPGTASSKSNPFGSAKPVDVSEKLMKIEEKLEASKQVSTPSSAGEGAKSESSGVPTDQESTKGTESVSVSNVRSAGEAHKEEEETEGGRFGNKRGGFRPRGVRGRGGGRRDHGDREDGQKVAEMEKKIAAMRLGQQ